MTPATSPCRVCEQRPAAKGWLCGECTNKLGAVGELCPEQVSAAAPNRPVAYLIDPWGRGHALGSSTVVTREPQQDGLRICAASISRHHALIQRRGQIFTLHDTGSRNGCSVNAIAVQGQKQLRNRDRLGFSALSFYFLVPEPGNAPSLSRPAAATPDYETREPPKIAELSSLGPDHSAYSSMAEQLHLRLYSSARTPGGMVGIGEFTSDLTELQYAFLSQLAQQLQRDKPSPMAGFVGIDELLTTLPWNSPTATDAQLKSLVYRIRSLLSASALPGLIERRRDLGYRLTLPREAMIVHAP